MGIVIKQAGEATTVTRDGKAIGWIVERIPCTIDAERYPFQAAIPSKYYGFNLTGHRTYSDAKKWIKEIG